VSDKFQSALGRITRIVGVRGAMLVSSEDGLVIADALLEDVKGNAVAALASSLAKRVGNASKSAGVGAPLFLHLDASAGVLVAAPANSDILMVVVAERSVNVGLVRLEMLRIAEAGL